MKLPPSPKRRLPVASRLPRAAEELGIMSQADMQQLLVAELPSGALKAA